MGILGPQLRGVVGNTIVVHFLNKTDRYDLYSGIALGVMQLNFGFLIYKFLTD